MPLNTQIERGGKNLKLRWGGFHVTAMIYAIAFERKLTEPNDNINYPFDPQPLSPSNCFEAMNYPMIAHVCPEGDYTLKRDHHFLDPIDGEVLQLKKGDKLIFWRSSKG